MMSYHLNHEHTIVGMNRMVKYFFILVFLTGGAILGYFFKRILEWLNQIEIFSSDSKISLITKFTNTLHGTFGDWATLFFVIIGLFVGFYFVIILLKESPTIVITEQTIEINTYSETFTYDFKEIKNIYYDKDELVIVNMSDHELLRKAYEINRNDLERTLHAYQYPYYFQDPYEGTFKKWLPNMEELSTAQNALLKARDIAKKHENYEEINELTKQLATLHIVVKDRGKKQYWRFVIS